VAVVEKEPRILLVDDDDLSRRMMGLLLSEKGYNYGTASNGVEAVEAVQSQLYDIVLMDLQMPVMDGLDATRKIREWEAGEKHVPIVALTAMLFENEIKKCLSAGMDDCIAKPFDTDTLFHLIDTLVDKTEQPTTPNGVQVSGNLTSLPVLDIQEALPRFSKDIQVYKGFLKEYIAELPDKIKQLRRAYISNDYKALADGAHNLKGISASMGAKKLAKLSQVLDQQSTKGNSLLIQQALEKIEEHVLELQGDAKRVLDE
jgi:CheY-like chemotaxis protein